MPVYEYRCPKCREIIEVLCAVNERPETMPCGCGGTAKRKFSAPAFIGFEYSDFRREYLAHRDKYPEAKDEIRFCEEYTRIDRRDVWKRPERRRKVIGMRI